MKITKCPPGNAHGYCYGSTFKEEPEIKFLGFGPTAETWGKYESQYDRIMKIKNSRARTRAFRRKWGIR